MLESHYCCGERRTGNEQGEKTKDESGAGALSLSAKTGKWQFLTPFSWLWLRLMFETLMGTVWQQSSCVLPTLPLLGRIALAKRVVVVAGERGEHVAGCPRVLSTVGKQPRAAYFPKTSNLFFFLLHTLLFCPSRHSHRYYWE